MARQRYVVRKDKEGKPRVVRSDERIEHRPGENAEDFDSRIRKNLYDLECREGSRFHIPGYSKQTLATVWR